MTYSAAHLATVAVWKWTRSEWVLRAVCKSPKTKKTNVVPMLLVGEIDQRHWVTIKPETDGLPDEWHKLEDNYLIWTGRAGVQRQNPKTKTSVAKVFVEHATSSSASVKSRSPTGKTLPQDQYAHRSVNNWLASTECAGSAPYNRPRTDTGVERKICAAASECNESTLNNWLASTVGRSLPTCRTRSSGPK